MENNCNNIIDFKQHTEHMYKCILDNHLKQEAEEEKEKECLTYWSCSSSWFTSAYSSFPQTACGLRNNPHVTPWSCHGNLIILFLLPVAIRGISGHQKRLRKRESEAKDKSRCDWKMHVWVKDIKSIHTVTYNEKKLPLKQNGISVRSDDAVSLSLRFLWRASWSTTAGAVLSLWYCPALLPFVSAFRCVYIHFVQVGKCVLSLWSSS